MGDDWGIWAGRPESEGRGMKYRQRVANDESGGRQRARAEGRCAREKWESGAVASHMKANIFLLRFLLTHKRVALLKQGKGRR
eukprot:5345626-Pleurochrysis_carterae.AAC.3